MKKAKWYIVLFLALTLLGWWLAWGNTTLERSDYTVASPELPEAFAGFRIAQVSDLHNAQFGEDNEILIQMLRDMAPDMIAITGDLVDSRNTDVEAALSFIREAVQIAPCFYITGNHEARIREYPQLEQALQQAGVTVLRNDAVTLEREGETIRLLGMDDYSFAGAGSGEACIAAELEALAPHAETGYNILLCHRPELISRFREWDIDLILSGHAHGGQIRLPLVGGLFAPDQGFFPEYDGGLYTLEQIQMVVSRGLGNSLVPLRVNNRPEVVLITLTNG